ncbi:MAG: hypothetical protein AB2411_10895, partial [Mesobacillus sp.]
PLQFGHSGVMVLKPLQIGHIPIFFILSAFLLMIVCVDGNWLCSSFILELITLIQWRINFSKQNILVINKTATENNAATTMG